MGIMMDNKELLELYNQRITNTYSFKPVASFTVRGKDKQLNIKYMYETILKLQVISGKFSLVDTDTYKYFDVMNHTKDGNNATYAGIGNCDDTALRDAINKFQLPKEYQINDTMPRLAMLVPLLSILCLLLSVVFMSYTLAIIGVALYFVNGKFKIEEYYKKNAGEIAKKIDDDVRNMRTTFHEAVAYDKGIMPEQVDMNIDNMSYLELIVNN